MMRPDSRARTGVWIGIGAIAMSFAAYTSALIVRQGSATDWRHLSLPSILYLNTLILLASSGTFELGRRRIASGRRTWLNVTLILGFLFVAGQVVAWRQLAGQGLFLSTTPNSSFFYVLTVLHALHLLGGMVALVYVLVRLASVGQRAVGAVDAVSLYWHFMGVLWLYLLLVLALRL
jgi:cytochrome c oxidase subunit III